MVIRVTGIVRIARDVQRRLQRGIPEEERATFLDTVATHVRAIRMICEEEGAAPTDLPAPSRRAYGVLERVLATRPEDLPRGSTTTGAATTVRIAGLLRLLDFLIARLGDRSQGRAGIELVASRARLHVQRVRALCEQQGASPAALPTPSGRAFAMLAWLSTIAHAMRYAAQHELALAHLEPVVCAGGSEQHLHVRFAPGRTIHAMARRGRLTRLKLSVGYLAASAADFGDLAQACALRDSLPPDVHRRYRAFHASEAFTEINCAIEDLWPGTSGRARGHAYDLDALFDRLNARYFEGNMARPRLEWQPSLSARRFGFYVRSRDLVVLDARLDDPALPEYLAECVLFHELLHKHHGTPEVAGRRRVHPPHFKRQERMHPRFEESERWLEALARGE